MFFNKTLQEKNDLNFIFTVLKWALQLMWINGFYIVYSAVIIIGKGNLLMLIKWYIV